MSIRTSTRIVAGLALAPVVLVLSGCQNPGSPREVLFGLDGSGSAAGMAQMHHAGVAAWLEEHSGEDLVVTAVGLTGTSGDARVCPAVSGSLIGEGNNADSRGKDRDKDRKVFLAQAATLAQCLESHRGRSDLAAFETIANVVGPGGTAVLFTDGIIHTASQKVRRASLANAELDEGFLEQFTGSARIDGISVEVRGAGAGSELTDLELAGLHRRWEAVITMLGGSLTTFTSTIA